MELLPFLLRRRTLQPAPTYAETLLGIEPANLIAYWPLSDSAGPTVLDESGNGRNGAAANVTFGVDGIGDGLTAASFGPNSTINIYSASFASAFNGQSGSASLWFKVSAASIWTDSTVRKFLHIFADSSNRMILQRTNINNQVNVTYIAGGVNDTITFVTVASTDWIHIAATWNKAAEELKLYVHGVQQGATATSLGTFAGAPNTTNQRISGTNATPVEPWSGSMAHVAIWSKPLTASQIATLATIA